MGKRKRIYKGGMMPLTATAKATSFDPPPAGIHPGIVYAVVDLGHQEKEWQGKINILHQVWIAWEFPELEFETEDGKKLCKTQSIFLTLSTGSKSNMLPLLEGWKGRELTNTEKLNFDVSKLIDHPCYVQIIHKEDGNGKIASLSPPDDRCKSLKRIHDLVYFSFEDGMEIPDNVPGGIKDIIMKSDEYNTMGQQND
jgi:hypothetical protein